MFEALLIYLLLGAMAGTLAGLLGVGGGLILVPLLVLLFADLGFAAELSMHLALGTSLTSIVFTAMAAVWAHQRRAALEWPLVFRLAPGLLLGGFAGALLAGMVNGEVLKHLFALFELLIALYMLAGAPLLSPAAQAMRGRLELFFVAAGIGVVSALLGIGGGTMTVPYLCWRGWPIHRAVAVSSACGLPIALAGAIGYCLAGLDVPDLPAWTTGYLYWPALLGIVASSLIFAPLGARLAHSLPVARLKRLFGLVLLLMAAMMLLL